MTSSLVACVTMFIGSIRFQIHAVACFIILKANTAFAVRLGYTMECLYLLVIELSLRDRILTDEGYMILAIRTDSEMFRTKIACKGLAFHLILHCQNRGLVNLRRHQ